MNICVIGLGSMGKRRIRLLKKTVPNLTIVGIDSNSTRAHSVSEEYCINCYATLDDVDIHLDCIFVCTSPRSHGKIIREALERHCHVFSEINLIDELYVENIQLAEKEHKVLFLSSTPLYKAEMQFIDKRIKQNKKPCVYQYHVGQYLPDWHPWDNLKDFFVSDKITNGCREYLAIELPWIQNTFGKINHVNVIKKKISNLDLDFPDTYLIQIEHENGNVGNFIVDVVSRQAVKRMEVFNEDIYIKWGGTPDSLFEKDISSGELNQVQVGEYLCEQGYATFVNELAYEKEIEEFFKVINGKQPMYTFEQDIETLRIIDIIEK